MKNELISMNNSKNIKNNSSMYTAENSSLQSKLNERKNRINPKDENKYSNTVIFGFQKRGKSNNISKHPKKNTRSLYLTDIMNTTNKEKDTSLKGIFELTNINNSKRKRQISKDSLPNITSYNKYIKHPQCFTCCNRTMNPKNLTKLYNEQNVNIKLEEIIKDKKVNIRKFREDKNDYLNKINDIKRIKYEINIKREAIDEYKENIINHLNSFNYTMSTIKEYKDNLENSFVNKYNDYLRVLNSTIREEKKYLDKQNEELLNLQKDVSALQLLIHKKEASLIKIKKWIILQIFIKDGETVKEENLNDVLEKRYNNKLIFETPEELDIILKHKEDKNLRFMSEYNKSCEENKIYMKELNELKNHLGTLNVDTENTISVKENSLNNLKIKKKKLDISLNELNSLKKKFYHKTNNKIQNKRSKSVNSKLSYIYSSEGEIKKNELGIFYKSINNHNNMFDLIDSIYNAFIYNNINGLSFNIIYINEINNINTSKSKRANIQMRIIEIGLNYLYSSIQKIISMNKNNLKIMEDTYRLIDLYHKRINGNKNKKEQENKRNKLMIKIGEKNRKVYFLPKGKIEKYNVVSIKKIKDKEKLKNRKIIKKIDIWDFLYDQNLD